MRAETPACNAEANVSCILDIDLGGDGCVVKQYMVKAVNGWAGAINTRSVLGHGKGEEGFRGQRRAWLPAEGCLHVFLPAVKFDKSAG